MLSIILSSILSTSFLYLYLSNSSISSFAKALKIQPNNSQYAYIYLLALDKAGDTKKALAHLKMFSARFSDNAQLMQLGLTFAQKLRDQQAYQYFYTKLQAL